MNTLSRRDLLLSLKYCTIEGCFSVPMLVLTLANAPFRGAYATKVLGWSDQAVGLLSTLHYLMLFIQPPVTWWLQRRFSLFQITALGFLFNLLPWPLTALFPWLGGGPIVDILFASIAGVSSLANSVGAVCWVAAVSELVPAAIRGRYFGKRWVVFTFWALLVTLGVKQMVQWFETPERTSQLPLVFAVVFTSLAFLRLCGLFFLYRMKFPPAAMEVRPPQAPLATLSTVFRDRNFMRFVTVVAVLNFCFYLGQPFYGVFLLKDCGFAISDITVLFIVQSAGNMASFAMWGRLCDRFGNKPIMVASGVLWFVSAAAMWAFTGPGRTGHVYVNYFITGFMMAGCQQIGLFALLMKLAPATSRAGHVSVYYALSNLGSALGPIVGGWCLTHLPRGIGQFLGQPLTNYHIVLVGSLLLCLVALHLLSWVDESAERPVREVFRALGRMRPFNPWLGITDLAGVFTPRGLDRLANASWRTLRRQTRGVADVGGELVTGGWHVLSRREARRRARRERRRQRPPS